MPYFQTGELADVSPLFSNSLPTQCPSRGKQERCWVSTMEYSVRRQMRIIDPSTSCFPSVALGSNKRHEAPITCWLLPSNTVYHWLQPLPKGVDMSQAFKPHVFKIGTMGLINPLVQATTTTTSERYKIKCCYSISIFLSYIFKRPETNHLRPQRATGN